MTRWPIAFAGWIATLLFFGFMAEQSHAQGQCGPRAELVKALAARYSETPTVVGLIDEKSIIEIFSQINGDTWTQVITRADGISCIIAAGKGLQFVPPKVLGTDS
jgi:hypothetical protein